MHYLAIRQDHLQADHVVGRHAVSEAVGAAGVLGDVAAERAGRLARRIGRVVKAAARNGLRQVEIDHPRLDRRPHVIGIYLQDAPHPGEAEHDPLVRDGTAGQAGARATRDDGQIVALRRFDDGHHVLGTAGEHYGIGSAAINRAVIGIRDQLVAPPEHIGRADNPLQLSNQRGC